MNTIVTTVERYGPQLPGEYWWQGYAADETPLVSFWTEERNPQDLIDLARQAFAEQEAEESLYT